MEVCYIYLVVPHYFCWKVRHLLAVGHHADALILCLLFIGGWTWYLLRDISCATPTILWYSVVRRPQFCDLVLDSVWALICVLVFGGFLYNKWMISLLTVMLISAGDLCSFVTSAPLWPLWPLLPCDLCDLLLCDLCSQWSLSHADLFSRLATGIGVSSKIPIQFL